ncbi:uncharacterized protein LACBIDRAFT_292004 [Laccaria bicolor S238N-H82]|uniref:Predicted protein n=1 Tax=Laccaria bicolor (strain S238N-H82 / ATCC MYA-4686) TaxID=486041 RepID=B0CTS4_LACBS|nr:uncharacterized protein LACBIDRAFT_292004 [Laccaria bicolor S238N-H82]EDR14545.1 predicted protein [Laccaria bicolor S238N-H82]|eukprot:XP_001875104.1 predicted protein [Laccaria bicolor S238N-H82]
MINNWMAVLEATTLLFTSLHYHRFESQGKYNEALCHINGHITSKQAEPPTCIMASLSEMDQLASLAGLLAVVLLRFLYVHLHKRRHQTSPSAKPPASLDEETQPLIAPSLPTRTSLSCKGKTVCHLAVIGYMVVTIFAGNQSTESKSTEVAVATIKEFGGPVLKDSRFVLGRGGMVANALIILARIWFYKSDAFLRELQADAVTLVAIPYVMEVLGTPVAQFPERRFVDFLAPAFGALCFFAAKD